MTAEQRVYKKRDRRPYIRTRPKGESSWVVCESAAEALDVTDGVEGVRETEVVWMTAAEYEALKEFDGW